MKSILLLFLLLGSNLLIAQYTYHEPKINPKDPQLPAWVKEMYADDPQVFEVDKGRNAYFQANGNKHDVYTRWYKRWRRYIAPFVNDAGRIEMPNATQRLEEMARWQSSSARDAGSWTYLGPKNHFNVKYDAADEGVLISDHSNVYCIDRCTANPLIWYCGTESGGVYKSTDGANSWNYVSKALSVEDVSAIAVDPTNPDVVLFSSANEIWRSTDGGINWSIAGNTAFQAINISVWQFNWHPTNNQIVFAATNSGLYRSTDQGQNWTQIFSGESMSVEFKPGDPQTVYALRFNSTSGIADFYKSIDGGASFSIRPNGWFTVPSADAGLIESKGGRIAVTLDNPNRVYVLLVGSSEASAQLQLRGTIGVYSSSNSGESWSFPHVLQGMPYHQGTHPNLMDFDGQSSDYNQIYYNTAFACSQLDENRLLIGGLNLWRSEDGGASYIPVGGYIGNLPYMHVDLQEFKVFRTSPTSEEFWFSSDGGLNRSTDWAQTHEARTSGLGAVNFWGIDQGWNDDILAGGRYHNGNAASNNHFGLGNFLSLGGGESPTGYVNYSPEQKTCFSDIDGISLPDSLQQVAGRFGMGLFPNESYYDNNSSRIMFDPYYWNVAYLGKDNILYKSTDGAVSFGPMYTFGNDPESDVLWMEQCASAPQVFYVQQVVNNLSKLFKSTNGGLSFVELSLPLARRELYFTVSHTNPDELWIAYTSGANGNKVYKSTNGGNTWSNITTPALNGLSIKAIAHQAGTQGGVYIASRRGPVHYRDNSMTDWTVVGTDMPAASYPLRLLPFYKKNKLRLGMWNIGVWENDLQVSSEIIAGFSCNYRYFNCPGDTIWFTDRSVSPAEAQLQWSFPGGSPSNSTERSPKVVYNTSGTFGVSLIVTYNGQSDTLTRNVVVETLPSANLPISVNNETGTLLEGWRYFDDGNDGNNWRLIDFSSGFGVGERSFFFDNYYIDVQGKRDQILTRNYLTGASGPGLTLMFDVAYARYNSTYTDSLAVYYSSDCGLNRELIYLKGGVELATAPDYTIQRWQPYDWEWRTESVNPIPAEVDDEGLFVFENRGRYGQPIYIDNIRVEYITSTQKQFNHLPRVFPVPATDVLSLSWEEYPQNARFELLDLTGRVLFSGNLQQSFTTYDVKNFARGAYFLKLSTDKEQHVLRVVLN